MPLRAKVYIGALLTVFGALLALSVQASDLGGHAWAWVALCILFFFSEYFDLYFHDVSARFGLSTSEAVILPMIMGFSSSQVVVGVSLAIALERMVKRLGAARTLFNVASYGVAASAATFVWEAYGVGNSFSVRNAAVGLAALLVFGFLTHVFTALVISLVERRSISELSRALAPTTISSTAASGILGLLFAATYLSAQWTVALFPLALGGLYIANRAVVRQIHERERIQHLQAATRALAVGATLSEAVQGFLTAVREIASASKAAVILRAASSGMGTTEEWVLAQVDDETTDAGLGAADLEIVNQIHSGAARLIANRDDPLAQGWRAVFGVDSVMVAEVGRGEDGQAIGYLLVGGRLGADDFSQDDLQLLEALGNELALTLGSYRLFQQVTDERERFARIFSGSTEGICLIDTQGVVQAWNPALERITGYSAAEVMGTVWSDVLMIRDRDQVRIHGPELAVVPPDEEIEVVTKQGPTRWVSVLAGEVQAEGGGWVVLLRDVTAQHEVEQAKSDFLSTISHELRTPLTTIKGSLQVLERNPESIPPELTRQMIGVTSRGAERLERLVMNLLIVSQIESGTMPLFADEVDLQEIIKERVGIVLRDHHDVSLSAPETPLMVRADRERFGQAIDHVFDNAVKFGRDGNISIEIGRVDGYAHVAVRDEGPGIPEADRDRIFDRFVRLGDVLTRETQGAGVGLFIARQAMTAMNGEIWVESNPDQGSTFHIKIPMARPMAVVRSEAS